MLLFGSYISRVSSLCNSILFKPPHNSNHNNRMESTTATNTPKTTFNSNNNNNKFHLVLLGDSIFDNASYVRGGKSVIQHLNDLIKQGQGTSIAEWRATLLAIDGDVIHGVERQLKNLPADATRKESISFMNKNSSFA